MATLSGLIRHKFEVIKIAQAKIALLFPIVRMANQNVDDIFRRSIRLKKTSGDRAMVGC